MRKKTRREKTLKKSASGGPEVIEVTRFGKQPKKSSNGASIAEKQARRKLPAPANTSKSSHLRY